MNLNRAVFVSLAALLIGGAWVGIFATERAKAVISHFDQRLSDQEAELAVATELFGGAQQPFSLGDRRVDVRRFMIRSQLAQTTKPIVFVGDSITEAARLPSSICGRPVVNAGIGGTSSASYFDNAQDLVESLNAPLIIIALGTNDAQIGPPTDFRKQYTDLMHRLLDHAPKLVLVGLPPIEDGKLKRFFDADKGNRINATIGELSHETGARFADVRSAIPSPHATLDGVHLTASSYKPWLQVITRAISSAMDCDEVDTH